MKKLLLTSVVTFAGFLAIGSASYADVNEQLGTSKYCRNHSRDVICMGPESREERKQMMEMTKEVAIETRSKYCRSGAVGDPICQPEMMGDMTGY